MGSLWKENGRRNGQRVRLVAGQWNGKLGIICRRLESPVTGAWYYVVALDDYTKFKVQCSINEMELIR